jgi:hypothetical protein
MIFPGPLDSFEPRHMNAAQTSEITPNAPDRGKSERNTPSCPDRQIGQCVESAVGVRR